MKSHICFEVPQYQTVHKHWTYVFIQVYVLNFICVGNRLLWKEQLSTNVSKKDTPCWQMEGKFCKFAFLHCEMNIHLQV